MMGRMGGYDMYIGRHIIIATTTTTAISLYCRPLVDMIGGCL